MSVTQAIIIIIIIINNNNNNNPGKAATVLHGLWVRQELERSLSVFPRDQFFQCNTTHKMLHPNEIAAMREMIKERDWIANSR